MTVLAFAVAVLTLAVALAERRRYRTQQRWTAERERIQARDERIAAHNGHPDGHVISVWPVVNGYDHPEPEELQP